jgi:hypothetical protein
MRLSADVLREVMDSLKKERLDRNFHIGRQPASVNLPPGAVLAPRAKVRPAADAARHRSWTVALRSVTASGVVFVDGRYWMDGERFILKLPKRSKMSAMLCTVTYWQPVASDLFVVSANFVRPLRGNAEGIAPEERQQYPTGF